MQGSPMSLDVRRRSWWKLTPLRIIVVYVIAGALWILLSDELLGLLVRDQTRLLRLEMLGNWLYTLLTAVMLYFLIRRNLLTVHRTTEALLQNEVQFREELEQRVAERTREIEQRRKVAEGLRDMLRAINSARPLKQVLEMIVTRTGELLDVRAAAIYRRQGLGKPLVMWQADESSQQMYKLGSCSLAKRAWEQVSTTSQPAFITDTDSAAQVPADTGEGPRCRAVLAVPLLVKGEVYGGLFLFHATPRP
ncbi:MAG: GAF domain-containing protein, partial [Anaerolineae bacterium]